VCRKSGTISVRETGGIEMLVLRARDSLPKGNNQNIEVYDSSLDV
jgi:hypothetical protein